MKTNAELSREIDYTPLGYRDCSEKEWCFRGTNDFFDTCRLALSHEKRGWYRRAIKLWEQAGVMTKSLRGKQYAINHSIRLSAALDERAKMMEVEL
ncbi:hypothetical protein SOASR030_01920 [Leminorella grimontii]|uniref:ANR family transcriptional regulator n=2 Tax=Leminorella grimontii TaxID=82981 RepID=A0AAV5MXP0_9GAMM|nr:hypothetical protein GLGR_1899 [Leminorella grimontii ATCC 33999 = DSM 5078]GKX54080.1 hypothetical protein SOASR030_01920 [Leminorella grimontii]VFS60129.1 Uncharacterised protein [Leminorella grimontii]